MTHELVIPEPHQIMLPPRCTRPYGLRIADRRHPHPQLTHAVGAGRPVYVWGAGAGGRQFLADHFVRQVGIAGVIDRQPHGEAASIEGVSIRTIDHLAAACGGGTPPFVVIASMYEEEIAAELTRLGLVRDVDFISA